MKHVVEFVLFTIIVVLFASAESIADILLG